MDIENYNGNCAVATCKINGKDASGAPLYGFFMCVVDSGDLVYDGELFAREPIDTEASLSEILAMMNSPRPEARSEDLAKYESELAALIKTSRMFQSEKSLSDQKALEHKITYFCTSVLSLNAISFLEIDEMSRKDLYLIMPSLNKKEGRENDGDEDEKAVAATKDESRDGELPDVVVACDPILDPVAGVAVGDIAVGTVVRCKLKEGSVFYNLMANASSGFDGKVTGDVTGVSVSDLGLATVAMKLSEGVTGAMKLAGTVKIKVVSKPEREEAPKKRPGMEIVLAIGGVIVFLCLMALLLHFLT